MLSQWGFSLGTSNYQAQKFSFNKPASYAALNTNASYEVGGWYKRKFGVDSTNHAFVQTGVEFTERFGDLEHDSLSIRIHEKFLNLPLIFGIGLTLDDRISYTMGVGLILGVLSDQKFYTPAGNGTTVAFLNEGKFGDYTKLSLLTDIGINYFFGKNSIARVGFRTSADFNSPSTSNGNASVFSSYKSYGMYLSIGNCF